jgi:hypothetical protein
MIASRWQHLEVFCLGRQKQDRSVPWVIKVQYITVPNAKERLSRVVAILLKAETERKKNDYRQNREEAG